jgi:hypothetical protein
MSDAVNLLLCAIYFNFCLNDSFKMLLIFKLDLLNLRLNIIFKSKHVNCVGLCFLVLFSLELKLQCVELLFQFS